MKTENLYNQVISSHDLLKTEFPLNSWVVEKLIPNEGITIFGGPAGEYKTWVMLEIIKAITSGTLVFGKYSAERKGILLVDAENHPSLIKERLNLLSYGESNEKFYYLSYRGDGMESKPKDIIYGDPVEKDFIEYVLDICQKNQLGIVFFDSLTRFHNFDENDAGSMSKVFQKFKYLTEHNITVVIIHHTRKQTAFGSKKDSLRGSSDIVAACDSVVHISKKGSEENKVLVDQPKLRCSQSIKQFELEVVSSEDSFEFKLVGDVQSRQEQDIRKVTDILEKSEEPLSKTQIIEQSGFNQRRVKSIVELLEQEGICEVKQGQKNGQLIRIVKNVK